MKDNKNLIIPIENIMSESFGKYAKYIIQDRALPDIRDGLKPVQRRIIHAMNELQLFADRPHKKSARTVGEVIGKYHPHGDSSIYEAMVRLSQEWKNNICLLDMHGNKGSIDGDGAAAMRYTECRLSEYGQLTIENIKKDTVKFMENFDGSEIEPTVLPTLFPNLLINGSTGIAAGYATNIPPFNPSEVIDCIIAKIDSPNCRLEKIKAIMPAPDFPTGGIISELTGMDDAYTTGRGKIVLRAKIEQLNKKQIVISSIPYETNKSDIVKSIDVQREKTEALNILEVRDESDGNGVSIVLETKPNANFEFIKNYLYKNTKLQTAYHLNMIAIKDRKPVLLDIFSLLQAFIDHAEHVILKTSEHDLNKAQARKEIVQGLIKAILIIDDVVSTIRSSKDKEEAIKKLINFFTFTIKQAEAIVNLRLYRLSNSDVSLLKQELTELEEMIIRLSNLVNNKDARYLFLKNKLREFKKKYGFARRCQLSSEQTKIVLDEMDLIENKNCIISVSQDGYLKTITKKAYLANDFKDNYVKNGDIIVDQFIANLRERTLLFTNDANAITIPNHRILNSKMKDVGMHINDIVTIDSTTKIIASFNCPNNVEDNRQVIICTKYGFVKRVKLDEVITKRSSSLISCGKLDKDDVIVSVSLVNNENDNVLATSKNGYANIYPVNQIPLVSKNSKGVKAMGLKDNDMIASMEIIVGNKDQIAIATNYGLKRMNLSDVSSGNRSNLGRTISHFITDNNSIYVLKSLIVNSSDLLAYVDEKNEQNYVSIRELNYLNLTSKIYSANNQLKYVYMFANDIVSQIKETDEE